MERLTAEECSKYLKCYHPCGDDGLCNRCDRLIEAISQLKEYKDAEEQGLLMRLPCKAGNMAYETRTAFSYLPAPQEKTIVSFILERDGSIVICCKDGYKIRDCKIGKSVFLTRQEAEKALEEQNNV